MLFYKRVTNANVVVSCRQSEGEELKTTSLNIMESADYKIGSSCRINNYPVIPVGFAILPTEGAFIDAMLTPYRVHNRE